MLTPWYLDCFVAVHWTVHCACTVRALRKTRSLCNSASGGVEAQSLFVGSSCEDESAFGLGFWHVQKGICSSLHLHSQKKNLVLLCWVAALKMSVCLDWGCGKCKREFVQACVCTSINRKLFPGLSPGSSQQTAILSNSLRRNLHAPFPPNQCCYVALLGKAVKKKKQPFRFGCRHALGNNIDQGGAGGSGVMWQHVGLTDPVS